MREWCGVWPGTPWDIYCAQDPMTTPGNTALQSVCQMGYSKVDLTDACFKYLTAEL